MIPHRRKAFLRLARLPSTEKFSLNKSVPPAKDVYKRQGYYLCIPADSVREEKVGDSLTGAVYNCDSFIHSHNDS